MGAARIRFLLAIAVASGLTACGASGRLTALQATAARGAAGAQSPQTPGFRFFAASSVWNQPLPADAPLAPESAALAQALAAEAASEQAAGIGPWINTTSSSTPIYVVGAHQPTVRVALLHPRFGPRARLQAAFRGVPIPAGALPAAGPDRQMTIYQPATDSLWEFFRAYQIAGSWHAAWGGAIRHVSRDPGYYTSSAWPGASSLWGASATSLPLVGGTMLSAELQRGTIEHALAISLPFPRKGVYSLPAQRSDGTGESVSDIPEGAHLRLDPTLNIPALHLPHFTEMMALAAQRYGIIVRDQTHKGIAFYAEDPTPSGVNPYGGAGGLYGGLTPQQLLADFPWASLQVLEMRLRASR